MSIRAHLPVFVLCCLTACTSAGGDDDADFPDALPLNPGDSCPMTHARVGATATLKGHHHDVAGTVTIVDDCTLRIDQFDYDGRGLDVRVYGAINRDFDSGFAMGPDLRRRGGYEDETIYARLPSGKTWDDADSLSIWCVDVSSSFGDTKF